jgi:hypothetical protein
VEQYNRRRDTRARKESVERGSEGIKTVPTVAKIEVTLYVLKNIYLITVSIQIKEALSAVFLYMISYTIQTQPNKL